MIEKSAAYRDVWAGCGLRDHDTRAFSLWRRLKRAPATCFGHVFHAEPHTLWL